MSDRQAPLSEVDSKIAELIRREVARQEHEERVADVLGGGRVLLPASADVGLEQASSCGVQREVALELTTARKESGLSIHGQVALLMTDFGIAPPKAMLGMLKTDPRVTVTFETVLTVPLT
jgi:hypothetical protein